MNRKKEPNSNACQTSISFTPMKNVQVFQKQLQAVLLELRENKIVFKKEVAGI